MECFVRDLLYIACREKLRRIQIYKSLAGDSQSQRPEVEV